MDKALSLKKSFASNALRLRESRGITQSAVSELAKKAGFKIDQKTVSRLEGGRKDESGDPIYDNPTLEKIAAIAEGVGVPPWELLMPANVASLPKSSRINDLVQVVSALNEDGLKAVIKHAQFMATDPAYLANHKGKRQ